MMERSEAFTSHVGRRIARQAGSRQARTWARGIGLASRDHERALLLTAVLLLEMSARDRVARSVEWIIVAPGAALMRCLIPNSSFRPTTGPLQLRGGPFRRESAIERSVKELDRLREPFSTLDLAKLWNGPTAGWRYTKAMEIAAPFAIELHERATSCQLSRISLPMEDPHTTIARSVRATGMPCFPVEHADGHRRI